ncbi:MAG: accessory gene regulator B family protein [Oscillospiraceae bacterium]|nr:accessory gene regulator B family protein [Oscillospiraceae bacterium]
MLLNSLSEKIADFLFADSNDYPLEVYIYGIKLLISSIIGMCVISVLGLFTGYFAQAMIYIVALSLIKSFAGGYHANTYLKCNTIFVISFLFSIYMYRLLIKVSAMGVFITSGLVFGVTLLTILLFSPVEHSNKKIEPSDRKKYKLISIIMLCAEIAVSICFYTVFHIYEFLVILPMLIVVDIAILADVIGKGAFHNENG